MINQFLIHALNFWSRAGGAGGGGGGGHGGGGGGYSYGGGYSGHSYGGGGGGNVSPGFIFLFIIVVAIILTISKKRRSSFDDSNASLGTTSANDSDDIDYQENKVRRLAIDPASQGVIAPGELTILENKVMYAFTVVQEAWSQQRTDIMRRFISDGVYQRFNAQFTMMKALQLTNVIENLKVERTALLKARISGPYEVLDIAIEADCEDQFVSKEYSELNSPGGDEEFIEVWTFIRRREHQKGKNIFASEQCPQCAAPLTNKLAETARCQYCGAYLNNGEFDWVLSEITQIADYARYDIQKIEALAANETLKKAYTLLPDFSLPVVEDRASNAFMQTLIAASRHDMNPIKRFCTGPAFEAITAEMAQDDYVYDRLYLNCADVVDLKIEGAAIAATVRLRYTYRRIQITPAGLKFVDNVARSDTRYVTLIREITGQASKGSIFANACPSCGAVQKDSLAPTCSYCGAVLNDPKHDWVIQKI